MKDQILLLTQMLKESDVMNETEFRMFVTLLLETLANAAVNIETLEKEVKALKETLGVIVNGGKPVQQQVVPNGTFSVG